MSVIKHSYVSAKGVRGTTMTARRVAAVGTVLAHVKYIQHRPGQDREEKSRDLFDDRNDAVNGAAVRASIKELKRANVVAHKIILAPEIAPEDAKAYTREVMDQLSKEKGLDLKWVGVAHKNTEHEHVHVVLLGVDKNGKDVRLSKKDHSNLREFSERYLKREHALEYDAYQRAKEQEKEKALEKKRQLAKSLADHKKAKTLELPWMHRKIMREVLEPYSEWQKNKNLETPEKLAAEKQAREERPIKLGGQTWTKESSADELRELNRYLWDHPESRLPKDDYKRMIGWIKEKEQEQQKEQEHTPTKDKIEVLGQSWSKENSLEELTALNAKMWGDSSVKIDVEDYRSLVAWIKEKEPPGPAKDVPETQEVKREDDPKSFEYKGKKFGKNSSFEELTEVAKRLREDKAERMPIDDYQKLRSLIEPFDRERWSTFLDTHAAEVGKQFKLEQAAKIEHGAKTPFSDEQQALLGNPVIGVFLKVATVAKVFVQLMPAQDIQDPLSGAHKDIEAARIDRHKQSIQPDRTTEQKLDDGAAIDSFESQLEGLEETNQKEQRKKARKEKEVEKENSRDDPFVFDPWGMQ